MCTIFSVHSVNPGRAWYPFLFIASESVHVVSLQALKTPGQTILGNTAISPKTTPGTFRFRPSWKCAFIFNINMSKWLKGFLFTFVKEEN